MYRVLLNTYLSRNDESVKAYLKANPLSNDIPQDNFVDIVADEYKDLSTKNGLIKFYNNGEEVGAFMKCNIIGILSL